MAKSEASDLFFDAKMTFILEGGGGQAGQSDDRILKQLNSAIELGLNPDEEAEAHLVRGTVYVRRQRLTQAETEVRMGLELNEGLDEKVNVGLFLEVRPKSNMTQANPIYWAGE